MQENNSIINILENCLILKAKLDLMNISFNKEDIFIV